MEVVLVLPCKHSSAIVTADELAAHCRRRNRKRMELFGDYLRFSDSSFLFVLYFVNCLLATAQLVFDHENQLVS